MLSVYTFGVFQLSEATRLLQQSRSSTSCRVRENAPVKQRDMPEHSNFVAQEGVSSYFGKSASECPKDSNAERENTSAYPNHSARPCGSYNPATQAGLQQQVLHHMRQASMTMPTYAHWMQPAGVPCLNEKGPLAFTLLNSAKPALQTADKESSAGDEQSVPDASHAMSTVIGALCMLLVQVPMLTHFNMRPRLAFTAVSQQVTW